MIEENAKVVSVNDDEIVVEAWVKSTCSSCNAQANCGTGAVARAFSRQTQRLTLNSPMPVNEGDTVVIGIAEKSVLIASWWLYLLPLIAFLTAILLLNWQFSHAWHELVIFALALLPTWGVFKWVARKLSRLDKGRFQPVLLRRL